MVSRMKNPPCTDDGDDELGTGFGKHGQLGSEVGSVRKMAAL